MRSDFELGFVCSLFAANSIVTDTLKLCIFFSVSTLKGKDVFLFTLTPSAI